MNYIKYIKRQDSGWKQQPGYSGETSINLSLEICEFLTFGLVDPGEELELVFLIYKEDFVQALQFVETQLPLYRSTSRTCEQIYEDSLLLNKINNNLDAFFGDNQVAEYQVTLYCRKDRRIYLKGLKHNGFTVRDFLVENSSAIIFSEDNGIFKMRLQSAALEP